MNLLYILNAFTDKQFKGNTAAVVMVDDYPSEDIMIRLAKEFGFSETAFVKTLSNETYYIRWFTPELEVGLCGHATLAAAYAIFGQQDCNSIVFESRAGKLTAERKGDSIELDLPLDYPVAYDVDRNFVKALSAAEPIEIYLSPKTYNLVLIYSDCTHICNMRPDFISLSKLPVSDFYSIIVSAADTGYDYVCRCFAPWEGIPEDPVTGSAQTCLAPYWATKLGKHQLSAYQVSERGGSFDMTILGDRLLLRGRVMPLVSGILDANWTQ